MLISKIRKIPPAYRNLSALQLIFWSAYACNSYLAVFLQRNGTRPDQLGSINAVISVISIMATPFWGMIADKIQSIRKIFVLCMTIAVILWAAIPFSFRISSGIFLPVYAVIIIWAFFGNPAYSLFDAFSVQRADLDHLAYGHVRLWGSFSFAAMNFLLSLILPRTGVELTFYIYGAVFIFLVITIWRMKGTDSGRKTEHISFKELKFGRLFKNYYFITYLLFAVCVYMPMSTLMVFLPYLISTVGGDTAKFGLLNACRAMTEIPVLLLMKTLRRRFPLPLIISVSAVLFFTEAFLYTKAGSFNQILAFQVFHGAAAGIMIGAAANYVYILAPKGLNSTAHTLHGAVMAVSSIAGNLIGGRLILSFGIFSYYRILYTVMFFAFIYFISSIIIGVKILKKPIPVLKI